VTVGQQKQLIDRLPAWFRAQQLSRNTPKQRKTGHKYVHRYTVGQVIDLIKETN